MHAAKTPLPTHLARQMLSTAYDEALAGLREGGIPIGAALFTRDGELLGAGHNRRVQEDDASVHAETDAFRKAGRRRDYPDCVMVTTLSPCWYCSGLVRQFNIGAVVIGESMNFHGGHDWLREHGVEIIILDDPGCIEVLGTFIQDHSALWNEDIGL
ncbi:MAG: nucleoside deaminase [Acidimicrobiales bacterium]